MQPHEAAQARARKAGTRGEDLLVEGIQSMIDGACNGLLLNLGHGAMCDPAEEIAYGKALVELAVHDIEQAAGNFGPSH